MSRTSGINELKIPAHIAVIMDGNGRWAKQRRLGRIKGHREGIESVRCIVRESRTAGVKFLSLFAFSSENWGRPQAEVNALMELLRRFLKSEVPDLKKDGVKIRSVGSTWKLPKSALETLKWAEAQTAECDGMTLILALSYGGREEIVHAVKSIVEEGLSSDQITEQLVGQRLYAPDVPDPDLLIRTSGEMRISNFYLWQSAYTELYITDVLWPDFREADFLKALQSYSGRKRRFGLTDEQKDSFAANKS